METRCYRRRRYLVRMRFQLKYAGLIILLVFLIAFISGATIYFTLYPFFYQKLSNVYPQGRLLAVLRLANVRLFFAMVIIAPFVAGASILFSHRIAGPLSRMELLIDNISKGDFTTQIQLRKKDELITLAESINKMVNSIKDKTVQQINGLENLESTLIELDVELQKQQPDTILMRQLLGSLKNEAGGLKELFLGYKLK